ncbi:hypothetical protein M8J75_015068 [Diaphorina citri]|nr:hypothetical protein M8J75_015068 [Diaphorina citri]KAI5731238.1 hypothetical protein M8J77_006825 [Diaphorina citri]
MGKKKFYKSKFNKRWLGDPLLQVWVQPSKIQDQTAFCPYCNCHLNGSKTLLQRHAKSRKHTQNLIIGTRSEQDADIDEPIFKTSDTELKKVKNKVKKTSKQPAETKTEDLKTESKTSAPKKLSQKLINDPLLKTWMLPSQDQYYNFYCKYCKCGLNGTRSDLLKHASSPHHIGKVNNVQAEVSQGKYNCDGKIEDSEIAKYTVIPIEHGGVQTYTVTPVNISGILKCEVGSEEEEEEEDVEGVGDEDYEEDDDVDISESDDEDENEEDQVGGNTSAELEDVEMLDLNTRESRKQSISMTKSVVPHSKSDIKNLQLIKEWKKDANLNKWIQASSTPGQTAFCKWCKCNLKGNKNTMIRHALTSKHKSYTQKKSLPNGLSKKKKYYDQKFNSDWLKDPALKSWIAPSELKTAFCLKCKRHLRGSKTQMYRHCQNPRHLRHQSDFIKTPSEDSVKSALRLSAFIAEHDLPLSVMDHFPSLMKSVALDSDIVKTVNCNATKTEFLIKNVLAIDRLNDLSNKLLSTVFSIIVDEAVDIFSNKSAALAVRYYDGDTRTVEESFLTIIDGTNHNLFQSIVDFFSSINVPLTNLLGFAADSCNPWLGKYSTVQNKLLQVNPYLYISGCVHHSFQYCVSDASSKLPHSYEKLCHDIYDYMQYRPPQVAGFEQIYPLFDIETQESVKLSNTSWLSRSEVVTKFVDHWDTLISYFSICAANEQDSKAHQILIVLTDPMCKLVLLFLNFFLPTVDDLNLEFQGTKYCLHSLLSSIGDKLKMILKFYMKTSYVNETALSDLNPVDESNFLILESMYFGARVEAFTLTLDPSASYEMILHFKGHCLNFYMEFCTQLLQRVNFKDPVLKYLYTLNPEICKSDLYLSIKPLAMLFPNVISPDSLVDLETEWWTIKSSVSFTGDEDFIEFWNKVLQEKHIDADAKYPLMTKFVKALLCLPHSSEKTKNTFTAIRRNKIKIKNKYDSNMMSSLLLIKEKLKASSAVEFEISDALLCLAKSSLDV